MASIMSSLVPLLITATILAAMMLFTMGIGWVSGKLLKRILGIGGEIAMEIFLPISGVEIMAWKLVLLGFTVGVIGGFFGVGGAFMVTPALNVFGFPMAYAIGTDMAHIAGKSVVATAKHRKYGNVDMRLGLLMIVGTAIGIEGGATIDHVAGKSGARGLCREDHLHGPAVRPQQLYVL